MIHAIWINLPVPFGYGRWLWHGWSYCCSILYKYICWQIIHEISITIWLFFKNPSSDFMLLFMKCVLVFVRIDLCLVQYFHVEVQDGLVSFCFVLHGNRLSTIQKRGQIKWFPWVFLRSSALTSVIQCTIYDCMVCCHLGDGEFCCCYKQFE